MNNCVTTCGDDFPATKPTPSHQRKPPASKAGRRECIENVRGVGYRFNDPKRKKNKRVYSWYYSNTSGHLSTLPPDSL